MTLLRSIFLNIFLLSAISVSRQNDRVVDKIIDLGKIDNKVMEHMDILTNRIGDRITGSDGYNSACTLAVNTMKSWGMMADFQQVTKPIQGLNPKYPFELKERTRAFGKGGRGGTDTFSFLQVFCIG